jgi:hypothetical protein
VKFIGIALRRPAFAELTAAAVMAVGLWVAVVGALLAGDTRFDRADAGALLVALAWPVSAHAWAFASTRTADI